MSSKQYESATSRTPREIWWKILDEAIYGENPPYFSTTFQGKEWAKYSGWGMPDSELSWYENSEEQRKIIGSVCRSWQAFAYSRRDLRVSLQISKQTGQPQDGDRALKARRVALHIEAYDDLIKYPTVANSFNWEIVEIAQTDIPVLSHIPLPRLRRLLITHSENSIPLNSNPLLDILSKFANLTWLEYEAITGYGESVPIDGDRSPVVLPNLQVLWYKVQEAHEFPFSHLILPSIQYLSLNMYTNVFPLLDVLSSYRRTLRSFAARGLHRRKRHSIAHFPPWDEFPQLEELVIDRQWIVHFQPLPPPHPLRRLVALHGSFDLIPSLLEGENMQEIIFQGATWTAEGGWETYDGKLVLDSMKVNRILEDAEERGVKVDVSWNEEVSSDRDEVMRRNMLLFQRLSRKIECHYQSL